MSVTAMTIVTRKKRIKMTKKRYLHKFFASVISYFLSFRGIFMLKTCVIFKQDTTREYAILMIEKFISDVEEQFEKLRDYLDNKCE